MNRMILLFILPVLILNVSCQSSPSNSTDNQIQDRLKNEAVKIKLVDRRLRIDNESLYWQYKNERGELVKDRYPLDQYAAELSQAGFRCESVRREEGSKSLDLVQKTLRINSKGFFWGFEDCKKLLIFRFKCVRKVEEYQIKDWGLKLAEMGFFCARGGL